MTIAEDQNSRAKIFHGIIINNYVDIWGRLLQALKRSTDNLHSTPNTSPNAKGLGQGEGTSQFPGGKPNLVTLRNHSRLHLEQENPETLWCPIQTLLHPGRLQAVGTSDAHRVLQRSIGACVPHSAGWGRS